MPGNKPKVKPVKLIRGLLFRQDIDLQKIESSLQQQFGPIDRRSQIFDFKFTDYYVSEMGDALLKRFLSYEKLIMPDTLSDIKNSSNRIESEFSTQGARAVNIDPGYLEESKLVLASTKNFAHRIYLRDGIWAEVTMRYIRGLFVSHDWTYPDHSQPLAIEFFSKVRDIYRGQLSLFYNT
jgi:hypothetical protein